MFYLPHILALLTGKHRYLPQIEWSDRLWTHNLFRLWELIFWRKSGIRCEAYADSSGRYIRYTWEAECAYWEGRARSFAAKLASIRVSVPVLVMPNGIRVPASPYLLAIAFDATGGKREAAGASPNTFSLTVSGSDRHLWINAADDVNGVSGSTYNSVALTAIPNAQINGINNVVSGVKMMCLIAPSTGANNLVTTAPGADSLAVAAASYTGCNQTTASDGNPAAFSQDTGTSFSFDMNVLTQDSWLICGMCNDQSNFTAGTDTTMRQVDPNYGLADSNGPRNTGQQFIAASYTNGRARAALATIVPAAAAGGATRDARLLTLLGVG